MSNEHVIKRKMIKKKEKIYIHYDNEFKNAGIKLDENERYIKCFTDDDLDITVVEILPEDNINEVYFLEPELEYIDDSIKNSQIYIPQYAKGKKLTNSRGVIKEIDKYQFSHFANTEQGSSGSPVFLKDSINVNKKIIRINKR